MAINIDHMSHSQIMRRGRESELKLSTNEAASRQQANTSVSAVDRVSLSKNASNLVAILNLASNLPVVDANHVEEIKLALNNGSYEIDSKSTAQKLIELESDLY